MSVDFYLVNKERKVFLDLGRFYEQDNANYLDLHNAIKHLRKDENKKDISVVNFLKIVAFIKRFPGDIHLMQDNDFYDIKSKDWYEFLTYGSGPFEKELK